MYFYVKCEAETESDIEEAVLATFKALEGQDINVHYNQSYDNSSIFRSGDKYTWEGIFSGPVESCKDMVRDALYEKVDIKKLHPVTKAVYEYRTESTLGDKILDIECAIKDMYRLEPQLMHDLKSHPVKRNEGLMRRYLTGTVSGDIDDVLSYKELINNIMIDSNIFHHKKTLDITKETITLFNENNEKETSDMKVRRK